MKAYVHFEKKQTENIPQKKDQYAFETEKGEILNRLRLAEEEGDRKAAVDILDSLTDWEAHWHAGDADILWYAILEKKNIIPFLAHVDTDDISLMVKAMQETHEDYSLVIGDYFEAFSFENAKALFCSTCFLERAASSQNAQENAQLRRRLIHAYFENLSKFVRAVYKPEILTESGISALPRIYRFGFYAGLALDAKRMGDDAAYLANLRLGLKEYLPLKDCIDFLLKDVEEEQKKRDAKAEEFSTLAKQVKRNIEQLIAQGDLKQAGAYTVQLAKLIPDDEDVQRYRKLTGTEPTMAELASHLPQ